MYCVYPVLSKRAETSVVLIAQHESCNRNAIFWSLTIYYKNIFSQCNLTAQLEPVQDKKK